MAQNVLWSGWLDKTGGAGHGHKNTRKRWFVLKGLNLLYYGEKPSETKEIEALKGIVYLPGATVKLQGNSLSLVAANKREILLSGAENSDLKAWLHALEYALKKSAKFKEIEPVEGQLYKLGGKGHTFQNWKKRYIVLKGNQLMYYEKPPSAAKDVAGLKGWIDLTEITQLVRTEDPVMDGCDRPNYIKIVANNDKEFFLAANSPEEKKMWFKAIKKQMQLLSEEFQLLGMSLKQFEEKTLRSGVLSRRMHLGNLDKFYFVLTTLNLRYYKNEKEYMNHKDYDFGKGQVGVIPLLGASYQEAPNNFIAILDAKGYLHMLTSESPKQNADWISAMSDARQLLIQQLIDRKSTISLHTNAYSYFRFPLGFICIEVNVDSIMFFFLNTDTKVTIPMSKVLKINLSDGDLFVLTYDSGEKRDAKVELRAINTLAIYDTIFTTINVIGELTKKKEKEAKSKSKEKGKSSSSSPPASATSASSPSPNKSRKQSQRAQEDSEEDDDEEDQNDDDDKEEEKVKEKQSQRKKSRTHSKKKSRKAEDDDEDEEE